MQHIRVSRRRFVQAGLLAGLAGTLFAATPLPIPAATGGQAAFTPPIYLDTSYSFAERAADLVSRMTIPEKASQAVSSQSPAIARLGIPAYGWWNEALHGVSRESTAASGNAITLTNTTSYPIDQSLGSSWDPDLVYKVAKEIGDEAREVVRSNSLDLDMYSPTMNLERDPRWGRNDESYGEDPLLVTKVVSQFVNGIEGKDQNGQLLPGSNGYSKVLATIKHYAANNSEVNRRAGSANMDDRTLREYYTAAFRGITQAAQPGSVMSSYNAINNVPTAADPYLIDTLLRQTFGFQGYVTSDCDAVAGITNQHPSWRPPSWTRALTAVESFAFALSAGEDLECNAGFTIPSTYRTSTPTAIGMNITTQTGLHTVNDLDTAVTRLFTARMELGEFDAAAGLVPWVAQARARVAQGTWVNSNTNNAVTETTARLALAREAGEKSLVLLKNATKTRKDGTVGKLLPMQVPATGAFKVLVTGFFGNNANFYLGGYSSTQGAAGQAKEVTPFAGIKAAIQAINPAAVVDFQRGFTGTGTTAANCCTAVDPVAVAAAPGYDYVIAYAGMDSSNAATTGTEDRDRTAITLPGVQGALFSQMAAANPNTVAVMETIGPQDVTSFEPVVGSILWSSYNGQRKGEALADVLLGTYNPSGHLPSLWYQNVGQIPTVTDYAIRPIGPNGRTYMYYNGPVAYPFGWGLSYTTFAYSNLHIDNAAPDANDTIHVSVDVTNSGAAAGNDVVQLYATTPDATAAQQRPLKRLEGFQKVSLNAGETKTVTLNVKVRDLAFFDQALGKYVVDPGHFGIQISESAADADIKLQDVIQVSGALNPVPSVVTVKPTMQGDAARDIPTRVMFPEGVVLVPNTTVATINDSLYGYIQHGASKPFPGGMSISYTSNRPSVVSVDGAGVIRTERNGAATITATATSGGVSKSTTFAVRVLSGLSGITVDGHAVTGFVSDNYNYDVTVPDTIATAPLVGASAVNIDATVAVTQATGIPGTATILVTGPDGLPFTYTVNFGRAPRSDEFNGTSVGSQWTLLRPSATRPPTVGGGAFTIGTEAGDLTTTVNTAKNLLLQNAFGDWTIESKATFSATPTVANQQGGIIAYQDDNNYLRFGWEFTTTTRLAVTLEDSLIGPTQVNQVLTTLSISPASRTIWWRMSKAGSIYTTSYSTDGTTFIPLWTNGATLTNVKVGLFAFNRAGATSLNVGFDYFHVTTAAATLPVTTAGLAPAAVNGAYRDGTMATLTPVDGSNWGIASTTYSLDGGAATPYTAPFQIFGDGAHVLTYSSTDNAGNVEPTKTLNFTIDATPPALTTSADVVTEATGPGGAFVTYPAATATDATDGPVAATCVPASGLRFSVGYTQVLCSATDLHANTGTKNFQVWVRDTTAPTVSVPADISREATGPSGAVVTYDNATATDIVDLTDPASCLPASGSTFALGETHVSCTSTDAAGNVGVNTFVITVSDTTPPALTSMDDVTVEATSAAGAIVTWLDPTAVDIVDGPLAVTCAPPSGSQFHRGSTDVLCTATDSAGNEGTSSFHVLVPHTTAPTVVVPDDIILEATGPTGAVAEFTASATDIVDGPMAAPTCTPASGSTFPVGATTVSCSATDSDGITGTSTFHVLVTDTTAPHVDVPDNVLAEATGPSGAAVTFASHATDIVDVTDAVTCTPPSGSTFSLGTTQVACDATDAAGNLGSSYFNVDVVDTTAPALVHHADITANATEPGGAHISFSVAASDLVDGNSFASCAPASGSLFAIGHTTVICNAADARGNASSTYFEVTVVGANAQITDLIDELLAMLHQPVLSGPLRVYLQNAFQVVLQRRPQAACATLGSFITLVNHVPNMFLTAAQRTQLVTDATRIRAVIGC